MSYNWDLQTIKTEQESSSTPSSNDYNDLINKPNSAVADIDDAVVKRHEHSNKSILDTITQALIDAWNSAYSHLSDTIKHITAAERTLWNTVTNKVDLVEGKGLSTEDYTTTEKTKLAGIADNANNYVHPSTHLPSIIAQDANNRFVTDAEKITWNSKASTAIVTTTSNGLMSSGDKLKLDGIEAGAEVNNISDANATDLTDSGDSTLHYHSADRNRVNHTGTQTAATISDFANTVRATVLTGLSTVTNAAITATDTVLSALGKLQKQISDNLTATQTALATKEPIITKNTAFNKNYGTTATDVKINGTQAVGSVDAIARIDHVHPVDTSRAAVVHTHSIIGHNDTRSTDFLPTAYDGASVHLKYNTTDGLSDGGTYHAIVHIQQWSDTSGGSIHQLAFTDNGNMYMRISTSSTTWGGWVKIAKFTDIPTSLPANGGNADTVDGLHSSSFAIATHTHTKSQITDMPTKLSQFENDIGAGGGVVIITADIAPADPSPGDFWYKVL